MAPPTALTEKADLKMIENACGKLAMLARMITVAPQKYKMIMVGTSRSETLPILLIPPRMTAPTMVVITNPVSQKGTLNWSLKARAMELDWAMFPVPNRQVKAPQIAKNAPMNLAIVWCLMP